MFIRTMLSTLALTSAISNADFSGEWNGSARAVDDANQAYNCTVSDFVISQTQNSFEFVSGMVTCGVLQWSLAPLKLSVVNEDLFLESTKVGTLTNDKAHLVLDLGGGESKTLHFERSGESLHYHEKKSDSIGVYFDVNGNLQKK